MARTIVCHYHIFKNAGTTFERVLDDNFGDKHLIFDGPFSYFQVTQDQLYSVIERNPSAIAFSSHQIYLPPPSSVDFRVVPVVFVRHPLLRIRSIYLFTSLNASDPSDAESAATTDNPSGFEDWLKATLADKSQRALLSNGQTGMLCRPYNLEPRYANRGGRLIYDFDNAVRNLTNTPCIARTEFFDDDVKRFEKTFAAYGIDFSYAPRKAENVSSDDHTLPTEERVERLQAQLSKETFATLKSLNQQDAKLYDIASELIQSRG